MELLPLYAEERDVEDLYMEDSTGECRFLSMGVCFIESEERTCLHSEAGLCRYAE